MSTPDVLWLHGDQLYDTTDHAWDARNLQPLTVPAPEAPLTHRDGCIFGADPTLAIVCPCTANVRYARRRRTEVTA